MSQYNINVKLLSLIWGHRCSIFGVRVIDWKSVSLLQSILYDQEIWHYSTNFWNSNYALFFYWLIRFCNRNILITTTIVIQFQVTSETVGVIQHR